MSRTLTAQDRSALIRLASSLPSGSPERRAILAAASGSPPKLLSASTLIQELNIGDEVTFFHLPVKMNDYALRDFRDLPFFAKGKIVGKKNKFTSTGSQEVVPFYDVELPDGRVMREVNPYYFQSQWPKFRDHYEEAFKLIMKALKPLGLNRVRSEARAGFRIMESVSGKPASANSARLLLRQIPNLTMERKHNSPFTIDMRIGESNFQSFHGDVRTQNPLDLSNDDLWRVTLYKTRPL